MLAPPRFEVSMRWTMLLLAIPLFAQGLDEATFKGEPRKLAGACADRARLLRPKDGHMLAEYGRAFLAAGDKAKAEACFMLARAESGKDGETHRLIAQAYLRNGHAKEGLKALEDMQLVDPKGKNVFTKAAVNLADAGLAKEGDALMERAWILDPTDWQNCVAYGRACLRKQRREGAAKWFARASQAKPQEERMWNAVALAYADHGVEAY
jgi:Flp pilus assembly protein TadD